MTTIPESQFKTDREAWTQRLEAQVAKRKSAKEAYKAAMSEAAHLFYVAGTAVENGEFGFARSQHADALTKAADALASLRPGEDTKPHTHLSA